MNFTIRSNNLSLFRQIFICSVIKSDMSGKSEMPVPDNHKNDAGEPASIVTVQKQEDYSEHVVLNRIYLYKSEKLHLQ